MAHELWGIRPIALHVSMAALLDPTSTEFAEHLKSRGGSPGTKLRADMIVENLVCR